jgi:hypothetical protein
MSGLLDALLSGGGGGAVSSVFGRTGAVLGQAGDYTSTQVGNVSTVTGATVTEALETLKASLASSSVAGYSFTGSAPTPTGITLTTSGTLTFSALTIRNVATNWGVFASAGVAQQAISSHANAIAALKAYGLLTSGSTWPISGSDLTSGSLPAGAFADATIAPSRLTNSTAGYAVLAVGGSAAAPWLEINAADHTVLRRKGTSLAFGDVELQSLESQAANTIVANATALSAKPTAVAAGAGIAISSTIRLAAATRKGDMLVYNTSSPAGWFYESITNGGDLTALASGNGSLGVGFFGTVTLPKDTIPANRQLTLPASGNSYGDTIILNVYTQAGGWVLTVVNGYAAGGVLVGTGVFSGGRTNACSTTQAYKFMFFFDGTNWLPPTCLPLNDPVSA